MSLYSDMQPQEFDGVIGNKDTCVEFEKLLQQEGGPRAFLISGPAGCGKGTICRIAANALDIDRKIAYKEINTADERGIDSVRRIIEQLRHKPLVGNKRIFVIDEAHGLTSDAKKAWLKPVEEATGDTYLFFVTTDTQKLFSGDDGRALKTRLTAITVKAASASELKRHLLRTLRKIDKSKAVSSDVCELIAEKSNGSTRQALVLLESILCMEDEAQQIKKIAEFSEIGAEIADTETYEFCKLYVSSRNWNTVAKVLKNLKKSKDVEMVRQSLMGYATAILLNGQNDELAWVLSSLCDYNYSNGWPGLVSSLYEGKFRQG